MEKELNITVSRDQSRIRLDRYLICQGVNLSRNKIQALIADGRVMVNGRAGVPGHFVKPGDKIAVSFEQSAWERPAIKAEEIPLTVVFEDEHLLVINKPAGLVVHPAPGNYTGTLVNALLRHSGQLSGGSGKERPGILHRLDKDTSGLLIVAKTDQAHTNLAAQLEARKIERVYQAIVWGHLPEMSGTVDAPVGRSAFDRKKMDVSALRGREAVTHYTVKQEFAFATLVELKLQTGRTHQIRVHMMHIGHPVLGDPGYGGRGRQAIRQFAKNHQAQAEQALELIDRQALHAGSLSFRHPADGRKLSFTAELPEDMGGVIDLLSTNKHEYLDPSF
ncbi:MAG: RluA family pseudouridine synthase [Candidatus Edwardsbacteria bacterium]|nr:RluA family pseudouridine synthase [Candidatus Edwardsbacteria bacterium]